MKYTIKTLWIYFVLAFSYPLLAFDLNQEREEAFSAILANPTFVRLLLENSHPLTEKFDYVQLFDKDTDVLLVGEEHRDSIPAREVNVMIKQLSAYYPKDVYMASEFLLAQEQPSLNQFAAGKISYQQLQKNCELPRRAFVAKIAKRYSVPVIGLDVSRQGYTNFYNWAMSREGLNTRNLSWTHRLLAVIKNNPHAKIILHAGSFHTQLFSAYVTTMPMLLRENGLRTKTLEFVSAVDSQWKQLNLNISRDTLFVIPSELKDFIRADYIIYAASKDFSEQEQMQLSRAIESLESVDDACYLDPDNSVCKVHIQNGRRE
jgi:hypothetical protein